MMILKQSYQLFRISKVIILIAFSLLPLKSYSQENTCEILNGLVNLQAFQDQFFINLEHNEDIIFVDTTGFFKKCKPFRYNNREVTVINHIIKDKKHILVRKIEYNKKFTTVYFYQPIDLTSLIMNGPTLYVKYKKCKRSFKIKDYGKGAI